MAANSFASPNGLKLSVGSIVTKVTYFFQAKFKFRSSSTEFDSILGLKYFN